MLSSGTAMLNGSIASFTMTGATTVTSTATTVVLSAAGPQGYQCEVVEPAHYHDLKPYSKDHPEHALEVGPISAVGIGFAVGAAQAGRTFDLLKLLGTRPPP